MLSNTAATIGRWGHDQRATMLNAMGTGPMCHHPQAQAVTEGSRFEEEIRAEQEEKRRQAEEMKQRKAAFKELQSAFAQ